MYLEFYNLLEKPFTLSPDPKYLYYSRSHKEALSQMIYSVSQESGFMALVGEVGTGKTMLINTIIKTLPTEYMIANIHYTALTPKGLIQAVCREFGIAYEKKTMAELIFKLQEFFRTKYLAGTKCVLFLDEAQNLSTECLEIVRMLTNTQGFSEKYLQIVLVGQPELDEKLNSRELRQLRERIALKFQLQSLERDEIRDYVKHRISVASGRQEGELFEEAAITRLHEITTGIPRRINIICDNALIYGYSNSISRIILPVIEAVWEDEKPEPASNGHTIPLGGDSATTGVRPVVQPQVQASEEPVQVTPSVNGTSTQTPDFEKIFKRAIADQSIALVSKPSPTQVILAVGAGFVIMTMAFLMAIFLAVKLDLIQ